jgi:hypothetical protein
MPGNPFGIPWKIHEMPLKFYRHPIEIPCKSVRHCKEFL